MALWLLLKYLSKMQNSFANIKEKKSQNNHIFLKGFWDYGGGEKGKQISKTVEKNVSLRRQSRGLF